MRTLGIQRKQATGESEGRIIHGMVESSAGSSPTAPASGDRTEIASSAGGANHRGRLTAVLAWVGIVAGIVFIVAVLFFSGFFLGRHSGWQRSYDGDRAGPAGMCPMTGAGGQMPMGPAG